MSDYNGWKNYETWCVSLWLSNDEGLYNDTRTIAKAAQRDAADEDEDRATLEVNLGDELRGFVEELPEMVAVTEGPASFVCDLLGAAMSEVDWIEIAANLLSEITEVDA